MSPIFYSFISLRVIVLAFVRYFVGLAYLIFNKTNKLFGSIKYW
jgi:hypothetical protein